MFPAIWAEWIHHNKVLELFFQIHSITEACYGCDRRDRYDNGEDTINYKNDTIFHSLILDSLIGFLTLAILHRNYITFNIDNLQFLKSKESVWMNLSAFDSNSRNFENRFKNTYYFIIQPDGLENIFNLNLFDETLLPLSHNWKSNYFNDCSREYLYDPVSKEYIANHGSDQFCQCPHCNGML
jgi:hypothetical protein